MNQSKLAKPVNFKYLPHLIITALIFLFYIQTIWFDFNYIDDNLIVFDEYNKINSLSKIPDSFVSGYLYENYYRPMVMISFIIDAAVAGQSPVIYRITNIILHIFVALLLFEVLRRFVTKDYVALISASLFAIHPLNVSAVSWIVGRNDLLLAFFSIASILSFILFREQSKRYYLLLSLTFYLLAILSKEAGVLIPAIFVLYEILIRKEKSFKINNLIPLFYFIIPAFIYLFLRNFIASINIREEISINSFVQNIYILFEYLAKTVYFFYIDPLPVKNLSLILIGILVLLLIVFYLLKYRQKSVNTFLFGILIALLFILPTLFVRVNSDDGEFNYIDCRMYLPLFGLIISFASFLEKILVTFKKQIIYTLLIVLFTYSSTFTFLTNQVYKDGEAYWTAALEKNSNRATYWMGLGFYYFDNKKYFEAGECATNAIKLKPEIEAYYYKAAQAYEAAGELNKANEFLEQVLQIDDNKSLALLNIIKNYLKLSNKEKANSFKNQLLGLDIANKKRKGDIFASLAYFYHNSGEIPESIDLMNTAILYQPNNPKYLNDLGIFYYRLGEIDSAKTYIYKAYKIEPNNPDFQNNLYKLDSRVE